MSCMHSAPFSAIHEDKAFMKASGTCYFPKEGVSRRQSKSMTGMTLGLLACAASRSTMSRRMSCGPTPPSRMRGTSHPCRTGWWWPSRGTGSWAFSTWTRSSSYSFLPVSTSRHPLSLEARHNPVLCVLDELQASLSARSASLNCKTRARSTISGSAKGKI